MRWTAAENLAYVVADEFIPDDNNVYVMLVPDGEPAILNGSAALIFLACLAGQDPLTIVVEATGQNSEVLASGVHAFVDELHRHGYIVPR